MNTDITLKQKLEDIVGSTSALTQWNDDYFDTAINRACRDIIRRIKMINPAKLTDFAKTIVSHEKEVPYNLTIGFSDADSAYLTGPAGGLLQTGHYLVPGAVLGETWFLEADSDCTAKLANNPYICIFKLTEMSSIHDAEIMRVKDLSYASDPAKFSVYRGMFGTKPKAFTVGVGDVGYIIYKIHTIFM